MMDNTWPGGRRHAMTQSDHKRWNAQNYPGTLQICCKCDEPTGRCEDDTLDSDDGPLCESCWADKEEEAGYLEDCDQYSRYGA